SRKLAKNIRYFFETIENRVQNTYHILRDARIPSNFEEFFDCDDFVFLHIRSKYSVKPSLNEEFFVVDGFDCRQDGSRRSTKLQVTHRSLATTRHSLECHSPITQVLILLMSRQTKYFIFSFNTRMC